MVYLVGEWVPANLLMGAAFVVAGIGVTLLGIWVVRGDRINREFAAQEGLEEPVAEQLPHAEGAAHTEEPRQQTPVH